MRHNWHRPSSLPPCLSVLWWPAFALFWQSLSWVMAERGLSWRRMQQWWMHAIIAVLFMELDLFSLFEGLGLTWVFRRVGINPDPTWRVAVELQELVHWLCGRAPITEGCGRGHRGWQAYQRAPCGHDLHLGSHPGSNDCHACHDSTPPPKGMIVYIAFSPMWTMQQVCSFKFWSGGGSRA